MAINLDKNTIQKLKIALARKSFYDYCNLRIPKVYDGCTYLHEICNEMQDFLTNDLELLIINVPPRHAKTLTKDQFIPWALGQNKELKFIGISYNQGLSRKSSKYIRNSIGEIKADPDRIVYSDIFPDVRLERGSASVDMWKIEGAYTDSYLASSPKGMLTGAGADVCCIDDLCKNAYEAYHEGIKQEHFEFFTDTLYSRLEGLSKVMLIMTRWATDDLAGRLIEMYSEQGRKFKVISKRAETDGVMLNPNILPYDKWLRIKQTIGENIANANYNQEPADLVGRLYGAFQTYKELPKGERYVKSLCDPADGGTDYLASVVYVVHDKKAFVLDMLLTQQPVDESEKMIVNQVLTFGVDEWIYEKNFGGKTFGKNVKRALEDKECYIPVRGYTQTQNKDARIYSASYDVTRQIVMPEDWERTYPHIYQHITKFNANGKNTHDDIEDVLTKITELINSNL
jgi:predicted phage terminase large subunit-like protein